MSVKLSSALKAALSNGFVTGLVCSKKKTFGHLVCMNGWSLNGMFAHRAVAFEMQREPLMARH
ncbi:hypothetical protein BT08F37_29770 [Escherichia coli]|nr:hypothetical protein [Escherichia coli]HAJ6095548.1 hypothetical protein [Escherichia coli]